MAGTVLFLVGAGLIAGGVGSENASIIAPGIVLLALGILFWRTR